MAIFLGGENHEPAAFSTRDSKHRRHDRLALSAREDELAEGIDGQSGSRETVQNTS